MIQARKISTTTYPIVFFMADSTDHITGKTSLTPTVTISKNGGSFGAASGAVAEIANGFYSLAGNATDRNTLGTLAIHASATGADPADIVVQVVNYDPFAIVDGVWDEILTGATHNVASSAGRRLRQLASSIIIDGVIVSATSNTVTFNGDASTADGAYDPAIITITSGNGIGQSRLILEYDGDTKTAILDRDWKVTPAENDEYVIMANPGRESVNEGMAQGGGANTITLNALASSSNDAYIGQVVFLRSGTGADQACRVTDYNGTTKVATVAKNWTINPDNTTGYVMLPTSVLDLATFIDSIWANDTRSLTDKADFALTSAYDKAKDDVLTPLAVVDGIVDAIKAKTDNLPASPAATGDAMTLTGAYDAAKTAATQTSVNTVDTVVDAIKATVDANLDMKISDIDPSVAISATEAMSVATGKMDISVYYTHDQTVTSTYAGNLSGATKVWFSVKENVDTTDANSLILMEKTGGLTIVNKTTYGTTTHGNIVVTGSAGDWDVQIKVDEAATANLATWDNAYYLASIKALIDGDAVHIWDGECRITSGVIRTLA